MEVKNILTLNIIDHSQVAEARRLTSYAATTIGFGDQDIGRVSLIVTELTNNLIKHAKLGGEFHLYRTSTAHYDAIEMLSIDKGPGMKNISECMRDGYSTAGSPGTGLGSINRMSDYFEIYSIPEQGTVILSRVIMNKKNGSSPKVYFDVSAILLPKPNQEVSGDKWYCYQNGTKAMIIVADGLGHGIEASTAALEAVKGFEVNKDLPLNQIMQTLNERMAHTRGAAVALCEINANTNSVQYCGVGNIAATLISPESFKNLVSFNGIVGHEIRKIQTMNYPWTDNSLLIMHSDGLLTRWNLEKYPGLFYKSLRVICAVLYRDFMRGNDDLLILGIRKRSNAEVND